MDNMQSPKEPNRHESNSFAMLGNGAPHDVTPPQTAPPAANHTSPSRKSGQRLRLPFRSHPVSPLPGETEQYVGTERHVILSGVLLTLVVSFIMTASLLPGQAGVEPGMPAAQDVFSPTYLRYESKVLTDKARADAASDPANEVWVQDSTVVQQQRALLLRNLSALNNLRTGMTSDPQRDGGPITSLRGITLTQGTLSMLIALPDTDYSYWRDTGVTGGFDRVMRDRRLTTEGDVQATRANLPNLLVPSLSAEQKAAAIAFISPLLKVNMHLDEAQTSQARDAAAAAVKPVAQTVQKGEAILRQGEIVTPDAVEKMQEAGLLSRSISVQSVVGTSAMIALLMLLLHLYLFRYAPQVWHRQKQLLLVALMLIATVAAARLFLPGHGLLPYMLPLAAVSMLIAVLLNPNVAVVVTFVLSILLGLIVSSGLSMDLPIYYFVGGLTGIFSLTRVERVGTFARAGVFIAVASFVSAIAFKVVTGGLLDWSVVESLALAATFNGGVSASITYATFSLLGTIFGITTPLQLMELAHPDQPLLRQLMREAPGTYHHSLVVSNLAERAAEMIGADALLTRVSAYYHDIGKVVRPYYFIDNQSGMSNIHDELSPRHSARIIAEHVRDGVRLGQKHKLPRRVLDAIPQHHGTMLIKYFYYKALKSDPSISQDDFRYPGPKPQTKETAILMLADGVEAAVRAMAQNGALDKPPASSSDATESPELYSDASVLPDDVVANAVHKIISERIEDGQLDECDLTVRDIARIEEAFVSMLRGIYHPRVAYPEAPRKVDASAAPITSEATEQNKRNGNGSTILANSAERQETPDEQPLTTGR